MMRMFFALPAAMALAQCAAPIPPVEVTRFHTGDTQRLGPVAISAASGLDAEGLEFRSYAAAVTRELVRLGFSEARGAEARGAETPWIAEVGFARDARTAAGSRSPISVGIGGGSYGGGIGVGVGTSFPIGGSGTARETVVTRLSVRLIARQTGKPVWEGRAETQARAGAPAAQTGLAADKLAAALFAGFPGKSGETVLVD